MRKPYLEVVQGINRNSTTQQIKRTNQRTKFVRFRNKKSGHSTIMLQLCYNERCLFLYSNLKFYYQVAYYIEYLFPFLQFPTCCISFNSLFKATNPSCKAILVLI